MAQGQLLCVRAMRGSLQAGRHDPSAGLEEDWRAYSPLHCRGMAVFRSGRQGRRVRRCERAIGPQAMCRPCGNRRSHRINPRQVCTQEFARPYRQGTDARDFVLGQMPDASPSNRSFLRRSWSRSPCCSWRVSLGRGGRQPRWRSRGWKRGLCQAPIRRAGQAWREAVGLSARRHARQYRPTSRATDRRDDYG
jgi:hypothetical protein